MTTEPSPAALARKFLDGLSVTWSPPSYQSDEQYVEECSQHLAALISSAIPKQTGEVGELVAELSDAAWKRVDADAERMKKAAAALAGLSAENARINRECSNRIGQLLTEKEAAESTLAGLSAENKALKAHAPYADILKRYVAAEDKHGKLSAEAREPFIREFAALFDLLNGRVKS